MRIVASIDPITRIEGHMKVELTIDKVDGIQQVVRARSVGTMFRGFENILIGRDPRDAQHITERICGVCPVSHAMAAVLALDASAKVSIPKNARILRNLIAGANFVDSHILHFYLLAVPDFAQGPAMRPWSSGWSTDLRLDAATTKALIAHYLQAVAIRRKAQEMAAVFGGRMPHPPSFIPGGLTAAALSERITKYKSYLGEIVAFIRDVYIPDVILLASAYSDYHNIGAGYGHLMAYGCFDLDAKGTKKLFRRGRVLKGETTVQAVDVSKITESLKYSYYENSPPSNPSVGATVAKRPKTGAYSWLKAPRYEGVSYEVGPLARMVVNGEYPNKPSVMDRHLARAQEALKIAGALQQWINEVQINGPVYTPWRNPENASAIGLTEAPRGALGHWLSIKSGKLSRYQIITPSCWNCSPRDDRGVAGALERALVGVPIKNETQPIEALRVIHSFDPCLDCAVHVVRPGEHVEVLSDSVAITEG